MSFADNLGFKFNPFSHDKAREHHEYLESREYDTPEGKAHGAPLSHEIIAGAAAFEVMKGYEKHKEAHGQEVKHATWKETLAGLAAAEAINIAEKHHHKLENDERRQLAVKAVQQTSHLANEMEERPSRVRRERDVEYESERIRDYE